MSRYKFMEYAIKSPSNRGKYDISYNVISMPFEKNNRKIEYWRSMFLYETTKPTENDPMFGNFYIECDDENFNRNRDTILIISQYLNEKYEIPFDFIEYFATNRSLWISLSAKIFGCYGSIKLYEIYKSMAIELNDYVRNKGYKGIDLSIYRWNGLIHSLGSYLPKKGRWVTKFCYLDLLNNDLKNNLLKVKYDNCYTFSDIKVIDRAKEWYVSKKMQIFKFKAGSYSEKRDKRSCSNCCAKNCMSNLEKVGVIENNRNLHIYSYSLYLKELNYTYEDAVKKIQTIFRDMPYVHEKECLRTIKSAINGKKKLSCSMIKNILDPDLIKCNSCDSSKNATDRTFIVPRTFITELHKVKANYKVYKLLIEILQSQQVFKKPYIYNLKNDKYRKTTIEQFDLLKKLNMITYKINNNTIESSLTYQENTYRSHIVLPYNFLERKNIKGMKGEFKLLLELFRCSILKGNKTMYFNIKLDTLIKNLYSSSKTIIKYVSQLKNLKLILGKYLIIFTTFKETTNKLVESIKKSKNRIINLFNKLKENYNSLYTTQFSIVKDIFLSLIYEKIRQIPLVSKLEYSDNNVLYT